jgi:hypothetical protein
MTVGGGTFKSFRATGLASAVDYDGAGLQAVLRSPPDSRSMCALQAVNLFVLLIGTRTDYGPPLGDVHIPAAVNADLFSLDRSGSVVIEAEVTFSPEDFETLGCKSRTLGLGVLRVTLGLRWGSPPRYTVRRFETEDGTNFAKESWTAVMGDVNLAANLLGHAAEVALAEALSSRSNFTRVPEVPALGQRQRRILDVVADYQSTHGEATPASEIQLSFPPTEAAPTEAALEVLVESDYLDRWQDALVLTPTGLAACARAGKAAGLAERLLGYLKFRAETERGRFKAFTWTDLMLANVAAAEELGFVRTCIAVLRLGDQSPAWGDPSWSVPDQMAELRAVSDLQGLLARAEQIRKQEVAAATEAHRAEVAAAAAAEAHRVEAAPAGPSDVAVVTAIDAETRAILTLLRGWRSAAATS